MRKAVAAKVRAFRLRNRLTREQVCSLLAITLDDYIAIEEGRMSCDEEFITDMLNLYGVDRKEFYPKNAEVRKFPFKEKEDLDDDHPTE